MIRSTSITSLFAMLFSVTLLAGCGTKSAHQATEPAADAQASSTAPSADEQATIDAELAKLSPDDLKLAETQAKLCPVSDHVRLDGRPIKVKDVNGRDVFICCEGCEAELRKNADKYLAKIKTE